MRVQTVCAAVIPGLALVIALAWLYASVPPPPPVHLIKCACLPDPAMQRLGLPKPLPFAAPNPPQFGPSR
jgi:hypothetical protein